MEESLLHEQYFKDYLALYPSFASFLGDRSQDGRWENTLDRSHNIKYGKLIKKYAKELRKYDGSRNIDISILRWLINDSQEGMKYPFGYLPIDSFQNSIIDFTFQNKNMYPLKTKHDVHNMIKRHEMFIEYIDAMMKKMKQGMKKRVVLPKIICKRVIESLKGYLQNKGYMIDVKVSSNIYHNMVERYKVQVERFVRFLEKKYYKACRDTIGMANMPWGKGMYRYLVRSQTTLDITPEYAHNLGLKEVSRISEIMNQVKVQLGYPKDISLQEFYKAMLGNKSNYFSSDALLMSRYHEIQRYINNNIVKKNFKQNVDDYLIKRIPKSLEKTSAGAFYYPGSVMGTRKGTFYVNMRDLKENPKYTAMTLSLHEGKPGHHYQFQYMIEKKIPIYRMYSVNSTGLVEGWALYTESLGDYTNNPYDHFGKLTYELFRAVRLVVDTGIHYYNWSFEEAVNYMMKHLAMAKSEIETEVERYICIPGQALCYKIGERKIMNLRHRYLRHFGNTSENIKQFHEYILEEGCIPLSILEKKIMRIIKGTQVCTRGKPCAQVCTRGKPCAQVCTRGTPCAQGTKVCTRVLKGKV
jgi:uncharacterized protein (DUF885 family)